MKLTGNYRYRFCKGNWFRGDTLVLQVEVEGREPEYIGGFIEARYQKYFRDARIEDITKEEMDDGKTA